MPLSFYKWKSNVKIWLVPFLSTDNIFIYRENKNSKKNKWWTIETNNMFIKRAEILFLFISRKISNVLFNEIFDPLDQNKHEKINHVHNQLIVEENPYLDKQLVFDVLKI